MGSSGAIAAVVLAGLTVASGSASASDLKDMIGKWKWTDYTVEVKECTTNPSGAGVCATVIDGPRNKGMEMIRSKLEKKGAGLSGQVAHPATTDIYTTSLLFKAPNTWSLDGCTATGVCAKGEFVRTK